MTILLICNHFPPEIDGVGDYTYFLAQQFQRMGHRVHVVCREQPEIRSPEGVSVHRLIRHWNVAAQTRVLDIIEREQADWVLLQYVPQGFQARGVPLVLPRLAKSIRQRGLRLGITFHEVQVRKQGFRGFILGTLQERLARDLCRSAQVCITSIEFYQLLLSRFHPDVRLIPVGSNIPPPAENTPAPAQAWFPAGTQVISTFGKRPLGALLEAVRQLHTEGMAVGLLVCGQTMAAPLAEHAPWARYTGYQNAETIAQYLRHSDLFVLPDSVNAAGEGGTCTKSGSLAAAYAAGVPVLGLRGDMTNALLVHGQNIWLLGQPGPQHLADALRGLLSHPEQRERLRAGGWALHTQHLAWASIAQQYLNLIQTEHFDHSLV